MSNVIDKQVCLQLNRLWQPTGIKTVRQAIIQLCGSASQGEATDLALDIQYELDENGNPNFESPSGIVTMNWIEWIKLPIRSWDLSVSSPNREIRVPTVIISMNHAKMPMKMFKSIPSKSEVHMRDGKTCQYTGKKLTNSSATIDHLIPKSRWEELGMKGSPDQWENVVCCDRVINEKKGNKLNHELGLKLLRKPVKPSPMPVSSLIVEAKHRDWNTFINKKS